MILNRLEEIVYETELEKQEFATKIDLTKTQFYKIEKGTRRLHVKDVVNIAKVYNINLNWLLLGIGDKKEKNIEDTELQDILDYLTLESQGSQSGRNLLIEAMMKNIIGKLKTTDGLFKSENNRPIFLLIKILRKINNTNEIIDSKGYLEKIIIDDTNEWSKTKEVLLLNLKKLTDAEVEQIIKYKEYFIEILENEHDFITKFLFMNKLTK